MAETKIARCHVDAVVFGHKLDPCDYDEDLLTPPKREGKRKVDAHWKKVKSNLGQLVLRCLCASGKPLGIYTITIPLPLLRLLIASSAGAIPGAA